MSNSIVPIDLGFVNAYLVKAKEGFVLVDTGMSGHKAKLEAALEAADCRKGDIKLLVITHADRDHAGNAAAISASYGAPIALHEGDRPALERGESPKRSGRNAVAGILSSLMSLSRKPVPGPRPKVNVALRDGQSLSAYGVDAKVLHLPGHTPGSIALLLGDGSLIAGDVFANYKKPAVSPFVWDFERYAESLERAKGLVSSIAMVYPGHGSPFEGKLILGMKV
jgi:glyoxylase-like metal-dependent hydrolase (beta-lactamase superfamily II)